MMKSINWVSKALILFISITLTGCSKSDDGGGDDFFIPDLSANWANKNDTDNQFFFLNAPTGVNTGTFTGNENILPQGSGQDHFSGSFTNHQITFKYDAGSSSSKSNKSYTGTINDASTEITLTSPDGLPALTLQKQ